MSTDRSTRALAAVFFLMAAGFMAVNQAVRRAPVGDFVPALVLFVLFAAFWVWSRREEPPTTAIRPVVERPVPAAPAALHVSRETPTDDLERIEGIGPKYRDALKAAGITTFEGLASASIDELEAAVKDAGLARAASLDTWAEQAKLAARNDWEALNALQATLTRGRRA